MIYKFEKEVVYPIEHVSKKLEVDVSKMREDCAKGTLKARKIGDKYFATGENFLEYFDYNREQEQ